MVRKETTGRGFRGNLLLGGGGVGRGCGSRHKWGYRVVREALRPYDSRGRGPAPSGKGRSFVDSYPVALFPVSVPAVSRETRQGVADLRARAERVFVSREWFPGRHWSSVPVRQRFDPTTKTRRSMPSRMTSKR